MEYIDYYLKACKVLESCETPEQRFTTLNYLQQLKKKFPKEESVNHLIDFLDEDYYKLPGTPDDSVCSSETD